MCLHFLEQVRHRANSLAFAAPSELSIAGCNLHSFAHSELVCLTANSNFAHREIIVECHSNWRLLGADGNWFCSAAPSVLV